MEHHDHSQSTHSAACDSCGYVAEVHAHSDDMAVAALSQDLANHNQDEHGEETDPTEIMGDVREKMERIEE